MNCFRLLQLIVYTGLILLTAACSLERVSTEAPTANSEIVVITATEAISITARPEPTATATSESQQSNTIQVQNQTSCNPRTDWKSYHVVAGDTLSSIASRIGSSVDNLVTANCLSDADVLQVGQALYLPSLPAPSASNPDSEQGYVYTFNYERVNDGGNYVFNDGSLASFTWLDADLSGLTQVEFIFRSYATGAQTSLGIDQNLADGASIQWQVSAAIIGNGGTVIASGRYPGQSHEGMFSVGVGINVN